MMRPSTALPVVYLCCERIDFRKGIRSLSVLVEQQLKLDPFSSHLFVFRNRQRNGVKILYWERSGFCLWQKKLERDRFHWPKPSGQTVVTLNGQALNWLLDGYDIVAMKPHKTLCYSSLL